MKVFQDLPKLLGENKELAVPLRVWLYPLDKLFSRDAKFQHEIDTGLSSDIETVIESLSTIEMKCNDLLTDMPALKFSEFHNKISTMKKNCYKCRLSLMRKLGSLLPKIRGKFKQDTELIDLLQEHQKSLFERSALEQWIKEKEDESDIIKSMLTQLNESEVMVETNLNKSLMDLKIKHLVIYTFTSLNWPDVLLSKQETYLSPLAKGKNENEKSSEFEHRTWLRPDIQMTMRKNLKVFKNWISLNNSESVKFIIASNDMENNPGSCILLYENESNKPVCFTSPSKPDSPVIEDVRDRQVVLKVSPACPATVELKLLYKTREENDWKSQTVSEKQGTVTLTDLRPDTEYQIKCAAVGKLNYTVHSDVTRLTVINQNLIKAKQYVIEDLNWMENKCYSLLENRETAFSALYKKIQDMQQNCQRYREQFTDQIKCMICSVKACEKESCDLEDLLKAHDESPFNGKSLKEWIRVKESELNTVNMFLQQLVDLRVQLNTGLDSYLSDIQVENVFSYTFTSLEQPDELLNEQNIHINPQMMKNQQRNPDVASQTWLTGSVREKMRENLKVFEKLMASHNHQSSKFMISIKEHEKHPGSCILLYENKSEAICFTPPSKPDSPVIEDVKDRRVVLKVSLACPATEELKLLYKMREDKDWTAQTVPKKQETVTLTDLIPDTEYQIKCAAVGKFNYTTESDVTTVNTKDKNDLIKKSDLIADGNPARYRLQSSSSDLDPSKPYRIITFGKRCENKPHKTILLVGETGTGKTTLINVIVNYMLGVQRKDKVWFEITDEQRDPSSTQVRTSILTVYEFYLQESPVNLTIIDTPGYGDPRGIIGDQKISASFLSLLSDKVIREINSVGLVMNATQNRLSDRQQYIFDAVQSLFGRDIAENIVLLFTHSSGAHPTNALTMVSEAGIKCAMNEQKNQPIFFLFSNCQSEDTDEEYEIMQEQAWNLSYRGMTGLFEFMNIKRKLLNVTSHVLLNQEQFVILISKLSDQELKVDKINAVKEACMVATALLGITLNDYPVLILQNIDFLIQQLKENKCPEEAKQLEEFKKKAEGQKDKALGYIAGSVKN